MILAGFDAVIRARTESVLEALRREVAHALALDREPWTPSLEHAHRAAGARLDAELAELRLVLVRLALARAGRGDPLEGVPR
jgi:hypothetical protein